VHAESTTVVGSFNFPWVYTSLFLVLSLIVRRDWIAATLLSGLLAALYIPSASGSEWAMIAAAFGASVMFFVLLRFGVVALMAWYFVVIGTGLIPLTLDPSAWYFGASLTRFLTVAGLAAYGAWASLGGRPVFGKDLLGED